MLKLTSGLVLVFATFGLLERQESASAQLPECQSVTVRRFVAPQYSEMARLAWIEGSVPARVDIDSSGRVKNVETLGGNAMLAERAADALRQWEFCPLPGPQTIAVTVEFHLTGEGRETNPSTTIEALLPYRVEVRTNPQPVEVVHDEIPKPGRE